MESARFSFRDGAPGKGTTTHVNKFSVNTIGEDKPVDVNAIRNTMNGNGQIETEMRDVLDSPSMKTFMKNNLGIQVEEEPEELTPTEEFNIRAEIPNPSQEEKVKSMFLRLSETLNTETAVNKPISNSGTKEYLNLEPSSVEPLPCNPEIIENKKACQKCTSMINAVSKFCPECGCPQISKFCSECGVHFTGNEKFCPECGKSR